MAQIYPAILAVMAEIGPIAKDKTNTQQNFKYRGIDDVMNALQPLLIKHKIFLVPKVLKSTREERQTKERTNRDGSTSGGTNLIYSVMEMEYTFYAEDGSSVVATVVGEGMDSGDKASNKAMAVAMKYACFQIFCIPTEEFKDPDAESHEIAAKIAQAKKADTTPPPVDDLPDIPLPFPVGDNPKYPEPDQVGFIDPPTKGSPKCVGCGTDITEKIKTYSVNNFGKPLCFECQGKARLGK